MGRGGLGDKAGLLPRAASMGQHRGRERAGKAGLYVGRDISDVLFPSALHAVPSEQPRLDAEGRTQAAGDPELCGYAHGEPRPADGERPRSVADIPDGGRGRADASGEEFPAVSGASGPSGCAVLLLPSVGVRADAARISLRRKHGHARPDHHRGLRRKGLPRVRFAN